MALVLAAPTAALAAKNSIGSVNATPRSISFGKVAVGSQSARNTFWISNDTKAVLWIVGVSAPTGRDADDFWFGRLTLNDCARRARAIPGPGRDMRRSRRLQPDRVRAP